MCVPYGIARLKREVYDGHHYFAHKASHFPSDIHLNTFDHVPDRGKGSYLLCLVGSARGCLLGHGNRICGENYAYGDAAYHTPQDTEVLRSPPQEATSTRNLGLEYLGETE